MQVYQLSIGAACGLSWPSDRIIIQVLDDSTDSTVKVPSKNPTLKNNQKASIFHQNFNYPFQNFLCLG